MPKSPDAYTIGPARYAKGKMAVRPFGKNGYKVRAGRLAEAIARGRWTGRECAYIMSPAAARRFERLYAEGWDASAFTYKLESPAPRIIRRLDYAIDAVLSMLARRTGIAVDCDSAAEWRRCWDLWPPLKAVYDDLYRRRGEAQLLMVPR